MTINKNKSLNQSNNGEFNSNSKIRPNLIIQIWQFCLLSSISGSLGLLLVTNGWSPVSSKQINIKGSSYIKSDEIIKAAGINFPKPLLEINPKQLELNILQRLPIKPISIQRRIIPPGLEIEILERKGIAFANRTGPNGIEKGMIDNDAYWIPIKNSKHSKTVSKKFYIEGWMHSHKNLIASIVEQHKNLGSPLMKIILTPSGEIKLETKKFKRVFLGSNPDLLPTQLQVLAHLSKSLSTQLEPKRIQALNLRDPAKPELKVK